MKTPVVTVMRTQGARRRHERAKAMLFNLMADLADYRRAKAFDRILWVNLLRAKHPTFGSM